MLLRRMISALCGCMVGLVATLAAPGDARGEEIDFNRDIRPLLSDRCFACHGPDEAHRKAGLRLDTREGATAVVDGVAAVAPGDPSSSLLWERITSENPDDLMPPPELGKGLTEPESARLKRWIEAGAPWADHWAYVAPSPRELPAVEDEAWALNEIDRWIRTALEREGMTPSPEASRATLLRRLSFDLTGLPPSSEETQAFLSSISEIAYEREVDRLLDSEHFGERMAMYWLDLVRYADTVGYHGDQDHNISPYRDYVIDAFNDNLPFDQFTVDQLAGDLLPNPSIDQKIATGYNRLLQTSHEGGVQPKEYLAIYAADRVRNVSTVWMGATVGCAQCHDHKFDPYTLKDFYRMAAFFADVDEEGHFSKGTNELPTRRPPEVEVLSKRERQALARVEADLKACEEALQSCVPAAEKKREELIEQREALEAERARIEGSARLTMVTVAKEDPRVTRVLPRGNWLDDSGEVVTPGVPAFMGELELGERRASRLDFAKWLVDGRADSGRLTARVMVNRLWYLFFGRGLSKSLDDFGGQGEPPVHPELLDHLALDFVRSGWDLKATIKSMVMSRTYRQASMARPEFMLRDPENLYFGRQSRWRLPAEMIRDAALHMSGLLDVSVGGASVKPYQPEGYYQHLNFPKRSYQVDGEVGQWRRGVYVHWQRQFLHPMLRAFDAPSREECSAFRPVSNTPTAALTLLNDPTFVEAARVFAERLLRLRAPDGGDAERFREAYRIALSRAPRSEEIAVLQGLLNAQRRHYETHPEEAEQLVEQGLSPVGEGISRIELAAWTAVARALLNLDETITRS